MKVESGEQKAEEVQRECCDSDALPRASFSPAEAGEKVAEGRMRGSDNGRGKPETTQKPEALLRLALLLRYPNHPLQREAGDCEEIAAFFDEIAIVDPRGLEELYTTTFDLNPVATLEIGWHLWGEQYERGRFLADLRGIQEQIGITEATELPDHLTLLLPTIAATDDEGLRDKCAKALEKILAPLEEHGNPYRHLLRAVRAAVATQRDQDSTFVEHPPHPASGHLLPRVAGEKDARNEGCLDDGPAGLLSSVARPAQRGEGGRRPGEGSFDEAGGSR